jgi:teichuronic acid biosynthesis protein TuaE
LKKDHVFLGAIATSYGGTFISYGPIYLCHILILVSFALWIFSRKPNIAFFKIKNTTLYLFPILLAIWYSLSMLWAIEPATSFKYLFYIGTGVTITLSIVEYATCQKKLSKLIGFTGIIVALEMIVSLLELLGVCRWPISPYSPLVSNFGRTYKLDSAYSSEIVEHLHTIPTGFHWNPNNTAVAILMCIPFFLFNKNWILKVVGFGLGAFLVVSGNSRMALITLALLLVAGVFYLRPRVRNFTLAAGFVIVGVTAAVSIVQKNIVYEKVSEAVASVEAMISNEHRNISSISVRRNLTENSKGALIDSWGMGVGGGNSVVIQKNKGLLDQKTLSQHNFWIELLVEGGVVFFLGFIGWISHMIFRLSNIYRRQTHNLNWIAGASSLSLIVFSFGCLSMSSAIYFMPMWILFGISIATINISKERVIAQKAVSSA